MDNVDIGTKLEELAGGCTRAHLYGLRTVDLCGPWSPLVASPNFSSAARTNACKVCGCTSQRACVGGCGWARAGLCTQCADLLKGQGTPSLAALYGQMVQDETVQPISFDRFGTFCLWQVLSHLQEAPLDALAEAERAQVHALLSAQLGPIPDGGDGPSPNDVFASWFLVEIVQREDSVRLYLRRRTIFTLIGLVQFHLHNIDPPLDQELADRLQSGLKPLSRALPWKLLQSLCDLGWDRTMDFPGLTTREVAHV